MLTANSGLRGSEIKKAVLGVVDLENRRIYVRRVAAKSKAGRRTVALNRAATDAVTKLYIRAQQLGANEPKHFLLPADLSRHTKATDPLRGGRGFDPNRHQESWNTAWRNLRRTAAERSNDRDAAEIFRRLRFHDMRHTFITHMAERNVPLQVVRKMVGHMSEAMTEHYTQISDRAMRDAVERLDTRRPDHVGDFVGSQDCVIDKSANLVN